MRLRRNSVLLGSVGFSYSWRSSFPESCGILPPTTEIFLLRLHTLGTLDLTGREGQDLHSVLAQPKRMALLLYFSHARPRGHHRRDTVLAMFWPELDERRARDALNSSLYYLRRSLGDRTIVSRGQHEVAVDRERLWCDSIAFEHALGEERWEEALTLYRGEFAPGLYADDAPEFQRWVDSERMRLGRLAARAARTLGTEARSAGDTSGAFHWAMRATELAVDEPAVRAKALAMVESIRTDLEREAEANRSVQGEAPPAERPGSSAGWTHEARLEHDPSRAEPEPPANGAAWWFPETAGGKVAAALTLVLVSLGILILANGPVPASIGVAGADERSGVVVFPFRYSGPESHRYLRTQIPQLLREALAEHGVRTAVEAPSREAATAGVPDEADPSWFSSIARRWPKRQVVAGQIFRTEGQIRVKVRLLEPNSDGSELYRASFTRPVGELFRMSDAIGDSLAARLPRD